MKECLVVLGMHRSGTSVLTGLISFFGGFIGTTIMEPTKDNPKGYFENKKIYVLNEKILRENSSSWSDYFFVAEDIDKQDFQKYVAEAKVVIQDELKYVNKILIKDPRICLLFPIWEQALNELKIEIKIVFAYRSPIEVSHSLYKRDEMPVEKGLMLWSHYFLQSELYSRDYKKMIVQYNDDFQDMPKFLKELGGFLGKEVTEDILLSAEQFYTPSLKHHKVAIEDISTDLPNYLTDLIYILSSKEFDNLEQIDSIRSEFKYSKDYYFYNREYYTNQKELLASREQEIIQYQNQLNAQREDFCNQCDELKNQYETLQKKHDKQEQELEYYIRQLTTKSQVLDKKIKDFNDTQDNVKADKKRIELLESRLVIGDEVFHEVLRKKSLYRKLRRSLGGSLTLSLKKIFMPFAKKSNKRLLNEKSSIIKSRQFSAFYYLTRYPDVWHSGMNPLDHFCRTGWKEGRNPSAFFSTKGYLDLYQDVARSNINPLFHYVYHGQNEGRKLPQGSYLYINKKYLDNENSQKSDRYLPYKRHIGNNIFNPELSTVLLVAHSAGDSIYGGERSFFDMVEAASKNDVNIVVVLPREQKEIIKQLKKFSSDVLVFKYGWWKSTKPVSKDVISIFLKIINKYNISILHANTIMLREPVLAAKQAIIPSIIHIRELITGDQALVEYIGMEACEIVKAVNEFSDYVIANSHETAIAYNVVDKGQVIHNTVDVELFDIDNVLTDNLKVGLISSNINKKGVFEFLQIAEKCKDIEKLQFVLIGPETTETKEMRSQVKQIGLNNFVFAGYKSSSLAAIEEVNIVLNISKFTESFGRTILEGMAARRPAIGYKWGALKETIVDGETGYLVPYMDTDLIVEKLKYFNENRKLVNEMGLLARERAVNYFSFEVYTKKLKAFYSSILNTSKTINLHVEESQKQKIAYFLWHFPVPSETFVLNELRVLIAHGYDVMVFCKQSPFPDFTPDFDVTWKQVKSPKDLAKQLTQNNRTIVHSHFTFPTVTNMVWPACEIAKVDFTFIAHAQDIFKYENIERNRIGEISKSPYCKTVFIPSKFHREYVIDKGVLAEKTQINPNGIDPDLYAQNREKTEVRDFTYSLCAIHRYTEKKGLENLILGSQFLPNQNIQIHIYGYGELEEKYRDLIKTNDIKNVQIHGAVKGREAMLEVFSQNDAFLCPSVRAENGDMDGIPTVLMEAMAYGIPVISTNISGIPDLLRHKLNGFITGPTPKAIANTINDFYATPTGRIASISKAAKETIYTKYNAVSLVNNLVRAWASNVSLDIIIVSWNNLPELQEVIRRIQKYTLTNYNLIICDNNSESDVTEYLNQVQQNSKNVKVFLNPDNSMVGPGSNIAIDMGSAEYIIYVCGKEGFVFDYMWEQSFIKYMDENPDVGLGGTLCYSPIYLTGDKYPEGVALFDKFRNKSFAAENPKRIFKHVQGGFFIIRRQMYQQIGGFSDEVKHNYTDVEYSYYAESCGWQLGHIKGMISLYNKSRPTIFSRLDETVLAMHPPRLDELPLLEKINTCAVSYCNICDWHGDKYDLNDVCPKCSSLPDDRTLFRYLAESILTYRRLPALSINLTGALQEFWTKQFQGEMLSLKDFEKSCKKKGKLNYGDKGMGLFYYDVKEGSLLNDIVLKEAARLLNAEGIFIIKQSNKDPLKIDKVVDELSKPGFEFIEELIFNSAVVQYGWNPLLIFKKRENNNNVNH